MKWLNIETAAGRSPEYVSATPVQRATWWNVLLWSVEQENGGTISGAASWSDRQWQQTCGVTRKEAHAAAPLLTWNGTDLVVWHYPAEKEAEIQAKRNAGAATAAKRWGKGKQVAPVPLIGLEAVSSAINSPHAEENGRKGNGTEGNVCATTEHTHMPDMEEYTLEALRARNPAVNLDIELRNARSYVKKNRGLDAEVDLKWFAEHWLPRCGPKPELAKAKMPVEPSDWRNRCRALAQADDAPLDMDRGTWRYFADLEWRRLPENVQTFLASQTPGA